MTGRSQHDGFTGLDNVPPEARARSPLVAHYADHFAIAVDVRATPEQYARAMFGDVPSATELFIWRGLLQLRLHAGRSPHTVAGWHIAERSAEWIRLESRSHSLTVHLVVSAAAGELALTTLVRYDRAPGRWAWVPLSAIHRRLAPSVLLDAVSRVGRKTQPE